jgi:hypothetical protein
MSQNIDGMIVGMDILLLVEAILATVLPWQLSLSNLVHPCHRRQPPRAKLWKLMTKSLSIESCPAM